MHNGNALIITHAHMLQVGKRQAGPEIRKHGRFYKFRRVFSGRDPGTLKSDIV